MYASTEYDLSLKEIAQYTLSEQKKLPYPVKLFLEPGRGLVATTGILITTVIGRVERKGQTWLFLDAGVYNALFETMAYQGSREIISGESPVGPAKAKSSSPAS